MTIRLAGAPISWGVSEVEGWGHQLDPDRVLAEMRAAGLAATELGPDGFLPSDPHELTDTLAGYDLTAVGGFVPVLLHDPDHDVLAATGGALDALVASKSDVIVLAAVTGAVGYDSRPELDDVGWKTLLHNLDRLSSAAADRGLRAVIHPHVGTMIENRAEVDRILDGSSIPLCLDTGHLLIGGTDPLDLVTSAPERIAHAHLKDVDAALLGRVRAGELTYTEAVARGMYTPLGTGDVDIAGVVARLQKQGYDGWYVLEQDTILQSAPADEGPVRDVVRSVEYLQSIVQ
ncbi:MULTISPECIES: sugar phosphate isomerase/epimerase [unclassified Rhodococcus (in: high G+C Gram-positive bacteria)]|uniref:sugar phosphate isomerase/epimerase family protein n=1 Tax=unclassified Rhodococcus (in: high G+C Gram-positive bacteria) TaxID=192944 RepID=UPI00163B37CA|nr:MULTISPECIES: sugar phosphate isomerase/epimerase [unclassified Rhodococcus (in: high G+C Gram-positive bacteria)]MBC2638812.1 TIM barrel protein [Rhodococcus sp. 3A]MBC2896447.1 TIM barrel protein [Rhodococcus sp. 4CII]